MKWPPQDIPAFAPLSLKRSQPMLTVVGSIQMSPVGLYPKIVSPSTAVSYKLFVAATKLNSSVIRQIVTRLRTVSEISRNPSGVRGILTLAKLTQDCHSSSLSSSPDGSEPPATRQFPLMT